MSDANLMQVGGDHYSAGYQHWDWVADAQVGYFEANATKYLSRHWKKGGPEDIKKAYHYVFKMLELVRERRYMNRSLHTAPYEQDTHKAQHHFEMFCTNTAIPPIEKSIMWSIARWRNDTDLVLIIKEIDVLYMDATAGAQGGGKAGRTTTPASGSKGGSGQAQGRETMAAKVGSGNPEAHNYLDGMDKPFGYPGDG